MSDKTDKQPNFDVTTLTRDELVCLLTGNALDLIQRIGSQAKQNHAYRYLQFAKYSDVGLDCKYAKASSVLFENDQRKETLAALEDLNKLVVDILKKAEELESMKELENTNE